MKLLDDYFALQEAIYGHFGYVENWRVIPLEDRTGSHWMLVGSDDNGKIVWSPLPLTAATIRAGDTIFSGAIYTQRFLPKWVYRAAEQTLVCVDPRTDDNKFLMVFDNALECTDAVLKELYRDCWRG